MHVKTLTWLLTTSKLWVMEFANVRPVELDPDKSSAKVPITMVCAHWVIDLTCMNAVGVLEVCVLTKSVLTYVSCSADGI